MGKFLKKQLISTSMIGVQDKAQKFIDSNEKESQEIREKIIKIFNSAISLDELTADQRGIVQVSYLTTLIASMLKDSNVPKDIQRQMMEYIKTALEL